MGEICEGYVRDEVRDESLGTPLNKGFLPKNVRNEQKRHTNSSVHNTFLIIS